MTLITGVGFSNFRVFEKQTFFNLAPLSIFTGTNSSGKSSIFKGLQLISSNADDLGKLSFSSESHKLGTFQLAKSRYSKSNIMRFTFALDNKSFLCIDYNPDEYNTENGIWEQMFLTIGTEIKEEYEKEELLIKFEKTDYDIKCFCNFKYAISNLLENAKSSANKKRANKNSVKQNSYEGLLEKFQERNNKIIEWGGKVFSQKKLHNLLSENKDIDLEEFINLINDKFITTLSHINIDVLEIDQFYHREKSLNEVVDYLSNNLLISEEILGLTLGPIIQDTPFSILNETLGNVPFFDILDENFINIYIKELSNVFKYAIKPLNLYFKNIGYIEAVRANSQRLYSNQSQGTSFNHLLLNIGQYWNKDSKNESEEVKFVEKWLQKFGIGEKLFVKRIKGIATEISIKQNSEVVDLIDLGYGVTQFLPILLYISFRMNIKKEYIDIPFYNIETDKNEFVTESQRTINSRNGNGPLLLIEEPESNLHPRLQSLLADLFIDVVKNFEVTLLIETHSEYLIRRLQVLTAAKEATPQDSVIYYLNGFKNSGSETQVRKININQDGSLTDDFGSGFIDEATNWKLELMRLKNAHLYNVN